MSFKKIIIIFFSLIILALLFWLIFEIVKNKSLINENFSPQINNEFGDNIEQENLDEAKVLEEIESGEMLESEEILEPEKVLYEEVSLPTIKKQMIVVEKED